MSVYLALHTSGSPSIEDIAEFGRMALAMGADAKQGLAVTTDTSKGMVVVLPIPESVKNGTFLA